MNKKINRIFDNVHAEDNLKNSTKDFLHKEIKRHSDKKVFIFPKIAYVCASLIIFFALGGFSYKIYSEPSAYVDMDINPSFELVLNRFNRVIGTEPYNDDAEFLLSEVDVINSDYSEAVKKLIFAMNEKGFFSKDQLISVTVQSDNKEKENIYLGGLEKTINSSLGKNAELNIFSVSSEIKLSSHDMHCSPAKFLAIKELQKYDSTATFENCRGHSIGQINSLINKHAENHHSEGKNTESENSNGHENAESADGCMESEENQDSGNQNSHGNKEHCNEH